MPGATRIAPSPQATSKPERVLTHRVRSERWRLSSERIRDTTRGAKDAIGRRPRLAAAAAVSFAWAGVAAWLAIDFSGRITDWSVMSDEMLYTKLAVSIADTGSPLPQIHDTH